MTRSITITLPEYVELRHYHIKDGKLVDTLPVTCILLEEVGCYGNKQYLYLSMSGDTVFKVKNGKIYQFPIESAINNHLVYLENQYNDDNSEDDDDDYYDDEPNYNKGRDCEMGRWARKFY